MIYTKPQISTLGEASQVIEATHQKGLYLYLDPMTGEADFNAAYDLDE